MDRTRYKRPETKTQRQTTKTTFGNPEPAPKVLSSRPLTPINSRPIYRSATPRQPAAARPPIDMELPGEASPARWLSKDNFRTARRFASRGVAVALVLVITLGGLMFSQSYLKVHKVFRGGAATAEALTL